MLTTCVGAGANAPRDAFFLGINLCEPPVVIDGHAWEGGDLKHLETRDPATTYDLHATVLRRLGIDHERLTFYHDGNQRRLTNIHGKVDEVILVY